MARTKSKPDDDAPREVDEHSENDITPNEPEVAEAQAPLEEPEAPHLLPIVPDPGAAFDKQMAGGFMTYIRNTIDQFVQQMEQTYHVPVGVHIINEDYLLRRNGNRPYIRGWSDSHIDLGYLEFEAFGEGHRVELIYVYRGGVIVATDIWVVQPAP